MNIGFIAVELFIPDKRYIEWSRLFQIKEIVSLDSALCPCIIKNYSEDDYRLIDWVDRFRVFSDLEWLIDKVKGVRDKQILAITKEPESDCENMSLDCRFKFYGYDLIDDGTGISALTNCGGFDDAFHPKELTEYGLVHDLNRAKEIQFDLSEKYPDELHAQCDLWAIWRMEDSLKK